MKLIFDTCAGEFPRKKYVRIWLITTGSRMAEELHVILWGTIVTSLGIWSEGLKPRSDNSKHNWSCQSTQNFCSLDESFFSV